MIEEDKGGKKGDSVSSENNISQTDANDDFFSDIAYVADSVGMIAAAFEAIVTDVIGAIIIVDGCMTGVGCVPAIGGALVIDMAMSIASPLGAIENAAGGISLLATGIADFQNGTSYFIDNNESLTIGIGKDTVVSFGNLLAGLVPESNWDMWISNNQLTYDNQRKSGALPAVTQYEFTIPMPNLWGSP